MSDTELFQRAKRVFTLLIDRPREEWPERLDSECGDDGPLRAEVESLLGHLDGDTDHLRPVLDSESVELPSEISGEVFARLEQELGSQVASSSRGAELARHLAELSSPRFREGDRFAGRYRMLKRLGAGGMGEVWKAHDEMLDEEVALKFIRHGFIRHGGAARDRAWIERLLAETSLARRITHPNVCRVHDASEVEGEFFLSMEFVPGHDLARRLRREGRFEPDAARRLAAELVDALHAIHTAGLLHRDLKPANILFGQDGAARVSDFGLAAASAEVTESDSPSGTRSYMAPELLAGASPSERSDVYALGLVLFEAMTNRRAFRSAEEITAAAARGELPPAPSLLVPEVDVLLEHLVKRCLAPRPEERPTSVELRRALAQSDPLEAVMSLGDPPSAEVIAGSSSRYLLSPRQAGIAGAIFFASIALLVLLTALGGVERLPRQDPDRTAELVVELAAELGFPEVGSAPYRAWRYEDVTGFHWRPGFVLARDPASSAHRWGFWYREAPVPLTPERAYTSFYLGGRTQLLDPPRDASGMTTLVVSEELELIAFETRRRVGERAETDGPLVDWHRLFTLAGLDFEDYEAIPPEPSGVAERSLAWRDRSSSRRVEMGISGGEVVAFAVLRPAEDPPAEGGLSPTFLLFNGILLAGLLAFLLPRALRHFRAGLGDPRSSVRLAFFCAVTAAGSWILAAEIPPDPALAFFTVVQGLLLGLGIGSLLWVLYQAVEPSLQRERPWVLVSWSRFLRGEWRAPLVRSHLLLGTTLGILAPLLVATLNLVRGDAAEVLPVNLLLSGSRPLEWFAGALDLVDNSILLGLQLLASLTVLRFLLRSEWAALLATWGIGECLIFVIFGWSPELLTNTLVYLLGLYALTRIGLLTFVALHFTFLLFEQFPVASGLDTWHAGASIFGIGVASALVLFNALPFSLSRRGGEG